eukprot:NODE_4154_length_853_cov_27.815920_g3832_i0.p1 GENE.NODE_4154_length_853_cov_27.815920_g3832_i0~~NODE_4154_length_853_cov_27.815920_g3832_i0.p1  ORF type:complete len:220 (+),score=46.85 NODE_4154_length_853_cov_27.815920_g3832_i0:132-791(+)
MSVADFSPLEPLTSQNGETERPSLAPAASATPKPAVKINNVLATFSLGADLDLKEIVLRTRIAEYNPEKFAGCTIRLSEPKVSGFLYTTGNGVVTGAKSVEEAKRAAKKIARIVQKLGFAVQFKHFQVHNMTGTTQVDFPVQLERLVEILGSDCQYDPEIFPGLHYRMLDPFCTWCIFCSGKLVVTGASSVEAVESSARKVFEVLERVRVSLTEFAPIL